MRIPRDKKSGIEDFPRKKSFESRKFRRILILLKARKGTGEDGRKRKIFTGTKDDGDVVLFLQGHSPAEELA